MNGTVGETVLEALMERLRARTDRVGADAPAAAVLWPDEHRQWEPLIPLIRAELPIITLGPWDPASLTGPAYWIRCVVDQALTLSSQPSGTQVIYLPGFARTDIRAMEDAPEALKPLAELQYRGATFAQTNGRDWTIAAFLESRMNGLGIEIGADQKTRDALLRARSLIMTTGIDELRAAAPLRAPFFDELLSPDLDRDVLRWLNDRSAFEASQTLEERSAFAARVAERLDFNLSDGEIAMALQLGLRGGQWAKVWQRYAEAPKRYPHVEERLADARPERSGTGNTLFEGVWGSWPQDNAEDEDRLRTALIALGKMGASACRDQLVDLAAAHAPRRETVWAVLERAPLAFAIEHLSRLASATQQVMPVSTADEMMHAYADGGWSPDDAVIRALECVRTEADRAAVGAAIRSAYEPWVDETARRFQQAVGLSAESYSVSPLPAWPAGTAIIFFDGMRLDIGRRLEASLTDAKRDVTLEARLAALPTITPTAKPAVSPVTDALGRGKFFAPA